MTISWLTNGKRENDRKKGISKLIVVYCLKYQNIGVWTVLLVFVNDETMYDWKILKNIYNK